MTEPDSKYYLLNIKIIDEQHQGFFKLHAKIEALSKDESKVTDDNIRKVLNELLDYIDYHFETEEKLLEKAGYSQIERHIKEHIFFINKIDEFIHAANYKNPVLLNSMLSFTKKWFLSHIMYTDFQYVNSLKTYFKSNPESE